MDGKRDAAILVGSTVLMMVVGVGAGGAADAPGPGRRRALTPDAIRQADAFNYVLGTQTIGVKYGFTNQTRLVETASAIREMGSNILKISMGQGYAKHYDLAGRDSVSSLVELARDEPSFRAVLDMPFAIYLIWAYPFVGGDAVWQNGFDDAERQAEHERILAFASYLLDTYRGTGKTFLLGHWEGDWYLHPGYDRKAVPSPTAVRGMIDWLNIRQDAVEQAKRRHPDSGVRLYHYTEVNLVRKAMRGEHCLTNDVLPHTGVDYVSYSCYDTINRCRGNAREELHRALDHIESKLKEKKGIAGKRVFIGEYGFPLDGRTTPALQDEYSRDVCRAALEWGCPFVLYWELYCNEMRDGRHRGFWLIDDKGAKQPFYSTLQRYYEKAEAYVQETLARTGRPPSAEEFARRAGAFLARVS